MLILNTRRLDGEADRSSRIVFDDLVGLAIKDGRVVFDNLDGLVIGVGIGTSVGERD